MKNKVLGMEFGEEIWNPRYLLSIFGCGDEKMKGKFRNPYFKSCKIIFSGCQALGRSFYTAVVCKVMSKNIKQALGSGKVVSQHMVGPCSIQNIIFYFELAKVLNINVAEICMDFLWL